VRDLFGDRTVAALAATDRVEWFRIDPHVRGVGDGIEGYRVVTVGPVVQRAPAQPLIDLLLSERTYRWGAASACKPTPGVALRMRSGDVKLFVIVCFECDELQLVLREPGGREAKNVRHNFRNGRPTLVRLAKEAFPKDRVIHALDEAVREFKRMGPPNTGKVVQRGNRDRR
jgi:hypothetical protein